MSSVRRRLIGSEFSSSVDVFLKEGLPEQTRSDEIDELISKCPPLIERRFASEHARRNPVTFNMKGLKCVRNSTQCPQPLYSLEPITCWLLQRFQQKLPLFFFGCRCHGENRTLLTVGFPSSYFYLNFQKLWKKPQKFEKRQRRLIRQRIDKRNPTFANKR